MSANATGTPTPLGIPKFNTASDAPNGKGVNEMMDALDSLLAGHYLTSTGDLLYASGANTPARLPIGGGGNVLVVSGGLPAWLPPSSLGGYEIAYDQITATVNVLSTTEGSPTSVIAGSSHVYENVPYLFEFFTPALVAPNGVDAFVACLLLEDGVNVGRIGVAEGVTAATGLNYPAVGKVRRTPSAGAHTYSVAAYCSTTTGTPAVLAGAAGSGALVAAYLRAVKA